MTIARASSVDRLLRCVGSEYLGGTDERSYYAREAAAWGTMVHHWAETGDVVAPEGHPKLANLFLRKLEKSGVTREQWWPSDAVHEAAVAIAPFGSYEMKTEGTREEKDAWKASKDLSITGTADVYWFAFDQLFVDDLKTGKIVSFDSYRAQTYTYALAIARVLSYTGPIHVTLTHWPRYPVGGQPTRFGEVIEPEQMEAFERGLVIMAGDIQAAREGKKPPLSAGEHCKWCPSRGVCPEVKEYNERKQQEEFDE